jgi:hypothetical protein
MMDSSFLPSFLIHCILLQNTLQSFYALRRACSVGISVVNLYHLDINLHLQEKVSKFLVLEHLCLFPFFIQENSGEHAG